MSILAELQSQDRHRVWAAAWEVVFSRDEAMLTELAGFREEIRAATRDVELGGLLQNTAIDFALRKLEFYAADHPCPCVLYLELIFYDPEREQREGNVVVHEEVQVDGQWTGEFRCACTLCGTRYYVVQNEYHYSWWRWTLADEEAVPAAP